ncbi:YceI family protein [Mycobacterium sp. MYCO198283]|uniref:YceI family protein n=1 Tax=Mycobacterium sp. MYCO198283 TaxID=2883505 RepID=UPI001E5C085F|nr:YceI family protein [Mycobacterium sp. MYCO198283]MCG5432409.1 YceI family protein [Mycobacterium sp. MYCO198283]
MNDWRFDASDGELAIRTDVTGRAARLGHRLTIAIHRWHAELRWIDDRPHALSMLADLGSLEVLSGDGGPLPLSAPERAVARSNALKSLQARRHPTVTFEAPQVDPTGDGYRLTGTLVIRGVERPHTVDVTVADEGDRWRLTSTSAVRQTEYGITPYSLVMGSVKVADVVSVEFSATRAK